MDRCVNRTRNSNRWILLVWLFQAVTMTTAAFVPRPASCPRPSIIIIQQVDTTTKMQVLRRSARGSKCSNSHSKSIFSQTNHHHDHHQEFQGTAKTPIRFLGKGEQAIVREGAVLLAPQHEFHHYYRQAAIFIYSIGTIAMKKNNSRPPPMPQKEHNRNEDNNEDDDSHDDDEADDNMNTTVIRGLIIDHPTAFTINDVLRPVDHRFADTKFGDVNLIHRGGDKGQDGLILLHNVCPNLASDGNHPINLDDNNDRMMMMIGNSGIYQGGWDKVVPAIRSGRATIDNFKAFFNYCEFTEMELTDLLQSNEDGDAWISVEVDSRLVLSQEWERGGCWRRLRNAVREYTTRTTTA